MNELLSLFIRTNDSPLDSSAVWDFLTLKDLYQLRSVCKHTYDELKLIEYNHCRDGNDYLVPFPGYPGVLCTNSDVQEGSGMCFYFLEYYINVCNLLPVFSVLGFTSYHICILYLRSHL